MSDTPFDPARHLTRVNGSDYLEVKWRLVWLRDRHPDAELETQLVHHEPGDGALFKAVVRTPTGGLATGYGSESRADFNDYLEKAESKAIGRALAHLGFGTQFAYDHEGGQGRPVDNPVRQPAPRGPAPQRGQESRPGPSPGAAAAATGPDQPATQRQLKYLQAVAQEAGLSGAALDERSVREFGVEAAALTRRDASALIDLIQGQAPVAS